MDSLGRTSMCRVCLKKQDAVISLFHDKKGISARENLRKCGVVVKLNEPGPSCICCYCLTELESAVQFLEKCEKSNKLLGEHLVDVMKESNDVYFENKVVDGVQDECESSARQKVKSGDMLKKTACCEACAANRRCALHRVPPMHTCPTCQKVFNRKFNFRIHLKRHSLEREFWCLRCGAGAVSRWQAAHHCGPRARRACPVPGCGKTYTTATNLTVHLRGHKGERPFECNDCGKTFSSKNTLQNHIRIHTGALPYICPVCGKQFRTNKLSAHMATHADVRYSCLKQGCSKRFTTRPALQRHARAHQAPPPRPPHACPLCSARYHHKQSLNKHVRKQHTQQPVPPADVETTEIANVIQCELD